VPVDPGDHLVRDDGSMTDPAPPTTTPTPPSAPTTTTLTRWERRLASGPLGRWTGPGTIPLLVLGIGLGIALLMVWITEELYDAVTERNGVAGLDRPALDLALRLRTPARDHAVTLFTNLGGTVGMSVIAVIAAALLCWWYRSWLPLPLIAVAAAGSLLMTVVGKAAIGRVRPPLIDAVPPFESSPSFPSGHTLNATVIVGLIGYLAALHLARRGARAAVGLAAGCFVLAIGLSRVYLGHHWLTDVLVGWALGVGWLAVVVTAHRLWLWRNPTPTA
jgi:membrane-associated phospholipid phosphatase